MRFWEGVPVPTVRRGHFWIAGERFELDGRTCQRAPLFAQWEAPEVVTRPHPVVLVHGGGYQGTEWLDTPDGRPGWAQRLVEAGYAVVLVDRPGHGRSPYHVETLGPMGPPFSYESARSIYFPDGAGDAHTQWPLGRDDPAAMDAFVAGYGPLPADLAVSQDVDADRLARLLDRVGPAVLLTHSASGPVGWTVADRRPDLVVGIVAIEPIGPPFARIPNIGSLEWGLAAVPMNYDPPVSTKTRMREAAPGSLSLPNLRDLPIVAVTAEASAFAAASAPTVAMLREAGADAELLHLPDHGVHGNGHGLIFERNSDDALQPVRRWLERRFERTDQMERGE
ncbi:alpha/beta fold hydrolase [Sphingomonas sp. RIT328]|uniref:alpha/beta fold hydrolase n=1 Tax=Sphingomonas sp. RIT328 TaxID=1470591 RepID=UPI00044C7318|nr:alpha/beta fold hydrolase [Sphingomonas sp. RIT328]EZP50009.1 Alpha/beta hydrolase family protein [Sphingomonas sp. RIT328]